MHRGSTLVQQVWLQCVPCLQTCEAAELMRQRCTSGSDSRTRAQTPQRSFSKYAPAPHLMLQHERAKAAARRGAKAVRIAAYVQAARKGLAARRQRHALQHRAEVGIIDQEAIGVEEEQEATVGHPVRVHLA